VAGGGENDVDRIAPYGLRQPKVLAGEASWRSSRFPSDCGGMAGEGEIVAVHAVFVLAVADDRFDGGRYGNWSTG
jgi:hypothetical protein